MKGGKKISGSEAAHLYGMGQRKREEEERREQDRVASLAVLREIHAMVSDLSVRSEPAALESVRTPSAALEEVPAGPGSSAWVRAFVAKVMDLPDAEFLALANKVMGRYAAAMDALAPPGAVPVSLQEDSDEQG